MTATYVQDVTACPAAIGQVRRVVEALLRCWGRESVCADAALCVTEMLTNVGKHTGSFDCVVTLEEAGGSVRLTVSDKSPDPPVLQAPDWYAESGRGLHLIATLAESCGWCPTPAGKDVWVGFGAGDAGAAA